MGNTTNGITVNLSQTEIDHIYNGQKRTYWVADFVNRCIDRRIAGIGLCNLTYASLNDEKEIIDRAYDIYCKIEDCNIAYNDTLDAVVDEVERYIADGTLKPGGISEKQKVQLIHLQMVRDREFSYNGEGVESPAKAAQLVKSFLGEVDRECLVVCATDTKMKPTHIQTAGIGACNSCPVSIPEIFKMALLSNASNIVLLHNHPSGDCTPSRHDVECTERVIEAGKLLGIRLLDHIILGEGDKFYSIRESGRALQWESVC